MKFEVMEVRGRPYQNIQRVGGELLEEEVFHLCPLHVK